MPIAECSALCHGGRLAEARLRAEELQRWATEKRTGAIVVGVGAMMSAQAELAAGRAQAADLFAHALALFGDTDPGGWFFRCHLGRAEAHALAGDATSAASSRAEAIRSRSPGGGV